MVDTDNKQTLPLLITGKPLALVQQWWERAANAHGDSTALWMMNPSPQVWGDLLEMQQAFLAQLGVIGKSWNTGLEQWYAQFLRLQGANTLSKLAEQECNLVGQFGDLVGNQVTQLVNLLEGTQVGYSYWVHEQRVAAADKVGKAGQ